MFFSKTKELENRVILLEKTLAASLEIQDELIKAFAGLYDEDKVLHKETARLELEIRQLTVEYLLHKVHKYHVVKDKDGKFKPDKLDLSSETEFALLAIKSRLDDKLRS